MKINYEVYLWPIQALLVFILEWGTCDKGKFANWYRPEVLLLGLIPEIISLYLTWQNSPKLCKHVHGGFLFLLFSFLRVYFLKHPFKKVPSSPRLRQKKSSQSTVARSYSIHSIKYLISLPVSPKVPRLVNANLAVQLQRFDRIAIYFPNFSTTWQRLD